MVRFVALGFLSCVGAFDETHIPIFKCHDAHLGGLEVVIDNHSHLAHIYTGWTRSAHDALVLHHSPLPGLTEAWTSSPWMQALITGDVTIPPLIMVNTAYLFLP